jgi:hypothetical protein
MPIIVCSEAIDPTIAERQAQLLELGAAAPMRARRAQDGTIGTPLFDALDQPEFDLVQPAPEV